MSKYILTNKAVEDLSDIWNYTFDEWSEHQANKYYNILINSCLEIAKNPNTGKNYEGIIKSLFGFKTGRHIIFYRKVDNKVEILRILHGQMDLRKRIFE